MLLRIFSAVADGADPAGGACAPSLELTATPGDSLSRAIWLSGQLPPLPLCGGLGRCGRCRVRFLSAAPPPLPADAEIFSELELEAGWRLACRRQVPDAGRLDIALPQENLAGPAELFGLPGWEQPTAACEGAARGALLPFPTVQILAETGVTETAAAETGATEMGTTETGVAETAVAETGVAEMAALGLAVDLGTTSVYWRGVRLPQAGERGAPEIVQQGRFLNPQAGAGADVMSRLAVARHEQGRAVLARLVRQGLLRVMDGLERSGVGRVERLCVAANTAMTDIFLDRPVEGLCAAPYRLGHQGHEWADVPGFPPVYIPPLPAPFAGGDVSAGVAALLAADVPRPFVLADLGTNGELALVDKAGGLLLASVPLGPALEGIGPQCGQLAGPGVITDFSLAPTGLVAHFFEAEPQTAPVAKAMSSAPNTMDGVPTIMNGRARTAHGAGHRPAVVAAAHGGTGGSYSGYCPCPACRAAANQAATNQAATNQVATSQDVTRQDMTNQAAAGEAAWGDPAAKALFSARGISATAYVSLLAILLRAGLLREDGAFVPDPAMPLARRLAMALEARKGSGGARLRLPHGQWLCAADVEELLKVKAAFALALESLLAAAGLAPQDVSALCLAGALGEHVRVHDLQTLGFIPPSLAPRLRVVGNASLEGAALLAVQPQQREELARLCVGAKVLSLVDEKNFHQNYLRHMRFGA